MAAKHLCSDDRAAEPEVAGPGRRRDDLAGSRIGKQIAFGPERPRQPGAVPFGLFRGPGDFRMPVQSASQVRRVFADIPVGDFPADPEVIVPVVLGADHLRPWRAAQGRNRTVDQRPPQVRPGRRSGGAVIIDGHTFPEENKCGVGAKILPRRILCLAHGKSAPNEKRRAQLRAVGTNP